MDTPSALPDMSDAIFQRFARVILRESGIHLSDKKKSLLQNRIGKRLRALGLRDPEEYLEIVETDLSGDEMVELIDAISTNVTYFYREAAHFALLAQIFSQWKAEKRSKIRVWCAASSSGEEPYTIAMIAAENLDLTRVDFRILATDICTPVLNKAIRGIYLPQQLRDLPGPLREKYLNRVSVDGEPRFEVSERLKQLVLFRRLNLSRHPFPLHGPLDVVFCRNVMIYFNRELRATLVGEFARLLTLGGYLMVGHSENVSGVSPQLQSVQASVYRRI